MNQPVHKKAPSQPDGHWPPRLGDAYQSWMRQADVYRGQGYMNEALFVRLTEELAWKQEYARRNRYEACKFAVEWLGALAIAIAISPLLLACMIINKATSRGPIFFYQLRCGQNARPIWLYKFRTFRTELQNQIKLTAPLEKPVASDPYTRFGRFMRNWRLDELPQLFNVLRGEMSLIGPRPLSLEDSVTIPTRYFLRFSVRPGMTGLWQATRPNTIDANHKLRFDCLYVRRRGVGLDTRLLLMTLRIVVLGEARFIAQYNAKKRRIARPRGVQSALR